MGSHHGVQGIALQNGCAGQHYGGFRFAQFLNHLAHAPFLQAAGGQQRRNVGRRKCFKHRLGKLFAMAREPGVQQNSRYRGLELRFRAGAERQPLVGRRCRYGEPRLGL